MLFFRVWLMAFVCMYLGTTSSLLKTIAQTMDTVLMQQGVDVANGVKDEGGVVGTVLAEASVLR